MSLRVKSVDELTTELADIYDELIAPKKIWRNHNNKIYSMLRAYAAGNTGIMDAALALHNRFDPLLCDDTDLYSIANIVGTDFKHGTGSMLRITITNENERDPRVLASGVYNYQSASGMLFSFEVPGTAGDEFAPLESKTVSAVSRKKGSFAVADNRDIGLFRSDSASIDRDFSFSCEDNSSWLGYDDETPFEFRKRILEGEDRQDHIKELELKIRNLPDIFECTLVFNDSPTPQDYDEITLAPKEILIIITGSPTDKIAELVCQSVVYDTHKVDEDKVVWYNNDLYVNGRKPVYYTTHGHVDFSLIVEYQFSSTKLKASQIEKVFKSLFKPYMQMVTHQDMFKEQHAYDTTNKLNLPGVNVLNIDIKDSTGAVVPYVKVPKTRLLRLTRLEFISVEAEGV